MPRASHRVDAAEASVLAIDAGQTGIKVRVGPGVGSPDLVFDGIRTHQPLLPQLTDLVRERWPDLSQAYIALQAADDRVSVVASFAAQVAQLAEDRDDIALEITRAAARELALSVTTALGRVSRAGDGRYAVCAMGGVFRSRALSDEFAAEMAARRTDVDIVAPRGEGIDGAVALADLTDLHPLSAAVHRATAARRRP